MTEKQKKFIDYYAMTGNASESCKRAGYKGNNLDVIGARNLNLLKDYLKPRIEQLDNTRALEIQNIFEFWTKVILDVNEKTTDRLRASELLAKAKGAFIEKVEVKKVDTDWFI